MYLEVQMYEGVNLALVSQGVDKVQVDIGDLPGCSDLVPFGEPRPNLTDTLSPYINYGPTKVLQTSSQTVMAVGIGDEIHVIQGEHLNFLQMSDKTNGECLRTVLEKQCA